MAARELRYQVAESNICKRRLNSFLNFLRDVCVEVENCHPSKVPRIKYCYDVVVFMDKHIVARAFMAKFRARKRVLVIKYMSRSALSDEEKKRINEIFNRVAEELARRR